MREFKSSNESKIQVLRLKLQNAGIDVSKWGTGEAKTLAHLQKEIDEGETILATNKDGKIIRKIVASGADIYYIFPEGKKYRLREDRQVFKGGRERKRSFDWSVSEKIKMGEDPKAGIIRGIQEELGIRSELNLNKGEVGEQVVTTAAQSYPGLQSNYTTHRFLVTLNDEQYKPEGYIEEQEGLTTYFVWEEVK